MESTQLNWIAGFIWGIADDVLHNYYTRGKYRDLILPMTVIRRLDVVLEPTKDAVLSMKKQLDAAGVTNQDAALRQAAEPRAEVAVRGSTTANRPPGRVNCKNRQPNAL